jgi:hypothetical protein
MEKSSHNKATTATVAPTPGLWVRPTQAETLLSMLRDCRSRGTALGLPAIMAAGLAQHSARVLELRRRGYEIKNQMVRVTGVVHSTYELTFDPEANR